MPTIPKPTTQPSPADAPTAEAFTALQLRVAAVEEFFKHFVTVLECERRGFTADRMNAWLDMSTARMQTTNSATLDEVRALRRLQALVVG
jgi:hypothetical protein